MSLTTPLPEHHHSVPPVARACPALDADAHFDDPDELRGEIYLADQLVAHAAELARAHGEPSKRVGQGRLWQRFVAVERQIHDAYAVLTARLRAGQDPSPAEEWLLENSHVVEDQMREIREDLPRGYRRELPRIAAGAMAGHPRVYALCLDYLRHTDARLDLPTLADYVQSYQSREALTIGELWAVPIMLRLGLLLTVGALAALEASAGNRERADEWAVRILAARESPLELASTMMALERREVDISAAFLVQLARRLRESDDASLGVAFEWLAAQSQRLGATPEELARVQHLRQAADQVSVGNAITSMRAVAALDWNAFFERTSGVEALLRRDPSGTYAATAPVTRDRFRHAVEAIARRVPLGELGVAGVALELALESHARAPGDVLRAHVGYYLVDAGRPELDGRVGYVPPLGPRLRRFALAHPGLVYFGLAGLLTLAVIAACVVLGLGLTDDRAFAPWLALGISVLSLVPASEIGLALSQALVTATLRPRLLPRLDFEKGVPPAYRTLVVVPCLLDSQGTIADLLADLEVRSLANGEKNLHFALLSDFGDAPVAEHPNDAALLRAASEGITALNERYSDGGARYWLLHRRRLPNPSEGCYMGWDRKRGKLEELNRLLRGARDTSFTFVDAPTELFPAVRYVITLDADTELPRDSARELIATIAHPLNAAELDPVRQRVVRGYGIVQPRVGCLPLSSRQSRYAALTSGPSGIDPYTTAISDVYQDLFAEGSYTGKAIYDVDAFAAALAGRAPENALLSHDLFESFFARSALVTDIELLDEQPAAYAVDAGRRHRWMRGDWQLLPWLLPRVPGVGGSRPNDLRLLDRWKLVDNLRRSLLAPTLVALVATGWALGSKAALGATLLFVGVLLAPLVAQVVLSVTREASRVSGSRFAGFGGALGRGGLKALADAALLLDQALLSLDAIAVALYRLITRRRMLEWMAMRQSATGKAHGISARFWLGSGLAVSAGMAVLLLAPSVTGFALPLLGGWALAPLIASWLSAHLPEEREEDRLTADDQRVFRHLARKTWRFFDRFVTAEENHLPPDNYQTEPRSVVAHRTSPTNIGLYLLSTLAAHDFGYIPLRDYLRRVSLTLDTLDTLPRRDGHLLNWYDTTTLAPLPPEYVSTVDSGNLAAYLWTLASANSELRQTPFPGSEVCLGIVDALELALTSSDETPDERFRAALNAAVLELRERARTGARELPVLSETLVWACDAARDLARMAENQASETRFWLAEAERSARAWHAELATLAPYMLLLAETAPVLDANAGEAWARLRLELSRPTTLEELVSAAHHALELLDEMVDDGERAGAGVTSSVTRVIADFRRAVSQALESSEQLLAELARVGARCRVLADGMSFTFLFDPSRELFSTGYNVSNARLDTSHYDLLASEARLASLVAIAKGDAPQKHWFRLARPRTRIASERALLSWSGSMFEYLMPLLVTESAPHSLLDETMRGAVHRQRSYGAEKHVPWGISESAYNVMDLEMTYQYRAFGVPGLGLKAGLAEDLVVTPYATALAALVDPVAAAKNLRALSREGLDGQYGYYEAIDYSPGRLPPGKRAVVVRSFMAHHLGMTLVALDNVLHDRCMQRRFHADPRIKASALLLEERIPTDAPLLVLPEAALAAPVRHALDLDASEHVRLEEGTLPRVHLLGHGAHSTLVTTTGAGALVWKGLDINRFREDSVFEPGGIYAYVRNLTARKAWSSGYHPTRSTAERYDAAFFVDRVELRRRDGAVETITEIVASAEHAAEVRRFTLKNHGAEACDIELTTFTELALAPRAADIAHRAFSGLFIETEALLDQGALVAHRRPRGADEPTPWVAQVLTPEDQGVGPLDYETSRADFIGRAGSLERPVGLGDDPELGRHTGAVLDAAFVLRRRVRLEAGATARMTLATLMADTRDELLHLVAIYAAPQAIPRAFELALADARVELRHLGVTAAQAHRFQRLLSSVLFPQTGLRAAIDPMALGAGGKTALWARGISGDLPIVVLRVDHPDFDELLRELLLAHQYYRVNGFSLDLVLLNEEPGGYLQPLQEHALDVVRSTHSEGHMDQPGGIFLRRADQISEGDRQLLLASARVVLTASGGSLSRQLKRAVRRPVFPDPLRTGVRPVLRPSTPPPPAPELLFHNGIGGFSPDGREYVMTLSRHHRTPLPWCNVMANSAFGCLVSESGSIFSWHGNSQRHRLTPWSNDPVLDPSGEVLYLRDEDDGSVWSPTPRPSGGSSTYRVAHGQGYSRFSHTRGELSHELTVFVSPTESLRFQRLRLENRGNTPRRLSVFGVVEWVLGSSRDKSRLSVLTAWDAGAHAMFATNPFAQLPQGTAFYGSTAPVRSFSANREEFFGAPGSRRWPHALRRMALSGQCGAGLDPCAALQTSVTLAPGESYEVSFVLGYANGREEARALCLTYADNAAVAQAFDRTVEHWDRLLSVVTIKTPDASLDVLMNRWLLYQATSCRIWARSAFYQSSGAYGFRDQLQDVLCLLHALPDAAREHLLRAAARQFVEGDVQHWWHPEAGDGVRTHCSDDLLWLPFAVAEYLRVTEDQSVLEQPVPFLSERRLEPEEHDLYSTPPNTAETATLYEHCARALDAALEVGPRGLPKMGAGDWNDGMNRIGPRGQGESVWLAWFLAKTLQDFAPIASLQKEPARAARWIEHARRVSEAAEIHGWDGAWYRRAFFDDGTVVGSSSSTECRIDAIAQSWAVIAGTADRRRAARAVVESERLLVREDLGIMNLLTPPFATSTPDPGYIASYPAGVRENGGQYTHGVLWTLRALAELGDAPRLERLLGVLNPIAHALTPAAVERYKVEPYVVAADVYSAPGHEGRGGWTWYTGSASWFYRIVLEDVLGFRRAGDRVTLSPCIPASWPHFELVYRYGRSQLHVVVENAHDSPARDGVVIDGRTQENASIPLVDDGRTHEVRIVVGERRLRSSA